MSPSGWPHVVCYPLGSVAAEFQYLRINWCADDKLVEMVDNRFGLSADNSPFKTEPTLTSPLSWFLSQIIQSFVKEMQQKHLLVYSTHLQSKSLAVEYLELKTELFLVA